MKKTVLSFIIPLAVFSLAVFAVVGIPQKVGAQTNASPTVSYISPTSGVPGTEISIYGSGYTTSSTVLFISMQTGGGYELPVTFVNSNKIIFTVPTDSGMGSYMLVAVTNTLTSVPPVYFTVNSTSSAPSITILSPNGEENYSVGQQVAVRWKTTGLPQNVDSLLSISDDRIPGWQTRSFFGSAPVLNYATLVSSNGSENVYEYKFTVPQNFNDSLPAQYQNIFGGSHYKMDVSALVSGQAGTASQRIVEDTSDRYFALSATSTTPCYTFTRDLRLGSRDVRGSKDVESLQNFLISKGFIIGDLTLGSSANKGYFGYATFQALKEYQRSIGIEATGYFGSITRASVNAACAPSQAITTTVTSPKGGETFSVGSRMTIYWRTQDKNGELVDFDGKQQVAVTLRSVGYQSAFPDFGEYVAYVDNKGEHSFTVNVPPGKYIARVVCSPMNVSCIYNDSGIITIVASNPKSSAVITSGTQTTSSNPVISGTASGNTGVGVVLSNSGGKVYGSGLIPVSEGKWSVTVSPALTTGKYEVTVYSSSGTKLTSGSLNVVSTAVAPFSGVVNIITRLDGSPLNPSSATPCVSTLVGPSGSNTAGCARSLTNQSAGTYTLKWENGYPAGADTTKVPTVSPVRFLGNRPAGENPITFYVDFKSASTTTVPATPTVSIISRLDGRVLAANEIPSACAVSLSTPKGVVSGTCSRTVSSSGPGTYAVRWYGSFPMGADTTKRPTVTSAQTLGTNNLIFYVDFVAAPVAQPSIDVTFVSADTSIMSGSGANDDTGIFRIKYKVTAVGGDVYIPSSALVALNYVVDRAGVPLVSSAISATVENNTSYDTTVTGNYWIEEGEQEMFTLTVSVPLGGTYTAGLYRTSLTGIKWGTADDMTPENTYTNLDGFKTSYVALNLEDIQNPASRSAFTASLFDALKSYIFGH